MFSPPHKLLLDSKHQSSLFLVVLPCEKVRSFGRSCCRCKSEQVAGVCVCVCPHRCVLCLSAELQMLSYMGTKATVEELVLPSFFFTHNAFIRQLFINSLLSFTSFSFAALSFFHFYSFYTPHSVTVSTHVFITNDRHGWRRLCWLKMSYRLDRNTDKNRFASYANYRIYETIATNLAVVSKYFIFSEKSKINS